MIVVIMTFHSRGLPLSALHFQNQPLTYDLSTRLDIFMRGKQNTNSDLIYATSYTAIILMYRKE